MQDFYPDDLNYCYGCGSLNEFGLRIKSYLDGEETVCVFHPKPYHIAIPGYVYGGLIASVIDCHCIATASAAAYRAQGKAMYTEPLPRFLTASLNVNYLRPTPIDMPMEVRAFVKEMKPRRAVVEATLSAGGELCACGEVVAIQMPEHLKPK
jgi:acyl-coenzyme A thioesterase PaaI-like protein